MSQVRHQRLLPKTFPSDAAHLSRLREGFGNKPRASAMREVPERQSEAHPEEALASARDRTCGCACEECGFSAAIDEGKLTGDHIKTQGSRPDLRYDITNGRCTLPAVPQQASHGRDQTDEDGRRPHEGCEGEELAICEVKGCRSSRAAVRSRGVAGSTEFYSSPKATLRRSFPQRQLRLQLLP